MKFSYKGLIAAVVTPTKDNGEINPEVIPKYIDHLLEQNVRAVFVNGTTGEWPSFSVDERKTIAESWIEHGKKRLDAVIIHCGAQSYKDAQSLVEHAASINADAVSCISPSVFKPHDEESHVAYFKKILEVAPDMPFMFYYLPGLTDVTVNFETFLPRLSKEIKSFVGLKISSPNLANLNFCLQFHEKQQPINICFGVDEQLHSAIMLGVESAVGSFYNFLGNEFNEIIQLGLKDVTKASEIQRKLSVDIIPLINKYGASVNKILTSIFSGVNMGQARLPMKQYNKNEIQSIRDYFKERNYKIK